MQTLSGARWDLDDLRARLVRYDELVPCTTAFIDTRTPGSEKKENFTIIGPGVAENPDQHVHIREPHGFNVGGARQPPGCVNSQHSHETAEVFVVHSGTWLFRTGEDGTDGEVILDRGDVISIPVRVFRGFENIGDGTGFLYAILGGDEPGHVMWAPYVFEAAKKHGLVLLQSGRLIDTAVGEKVPEGALVQTPTTKDMMASLRKLDSEALQRCVVKASEMTPAKQGFLAGPGVLESPVVGAETSEAEGFVSPPGKLAWPHGFQLKHLRILRGESTRRYRRRVAEVWFVQAGRVVLEADDAAFELGPGDVFTAPADTPRRLRNKGDADAEIYAILGTDRPTAAIV